MTDPSSTTPEPPVKGKPSKAKPADDVAPVPAPGTIPVAQVVELKGHVPPAAGVTGPAVPVDGAEPGQVTIRCRYPVTTFDDGDGTVIAAAGTKVPGDKVPSLIAAANTAGVTLERVL